MTHVDDIPFLPEVTAVDVPDFGETRPVAAASTGRAAPIAGAEPVRLPLATARRIGETVAERLRPFCHRIEVAGSIRRQRTMCGDVDLVVLPSDLTGLIGRVRQSCTLKVAGDLNMIAVMANGVQLDIFVAKPAGMDLFARVPGTFGTLMVCRTGSRQFNIWLAERAKAMGLHWNPYRGVCRGGSLTGEVIASETEEDVFQALDLDFIRPEQRER